MKVNIEFDLTPEEMRRLLGLPDVSPVNELIVEKLREQTEKGLDGTLVRELFQGMVKSGVAGIEAYQQLLGALMGRRGESGGAARPAAASSQDENLGAENR